MTTTPDSRAAEAAANGCPVVDFDFTESRPALEYFTALDQLREEAPIVYLRTGSVSALRGVFGPASGQPGGAR